MPGNLVEMIHGTIRFEVQPVSGPDSRGVLAIDAPRFRMVRTYDVPPAFQLASSFRGYVGYDDNGLPVVAAGPGARLHEAANRRTPGDGRQGPRD